MKTKHAGCSRNPATGAAQERSKERPGILSVLSRHPAPAHSPGKYGNLQAKLKAPNSILGIPGLLLRAKSQKTRATISVWRGAYLNLPENFAVKCDDHGEVTTSDTWKDARRMSRDPAGWCEKCREQSRTETSAA